MDFPVEEIIQSFEQKLSTNRQQALKKWINESPSNRQQYLELVKIYRATGKIKFKFDVDEVGALKKVNHRLSRRHFLRISQRVAAALILLMLISQSIFLIFPDIVWQKITATNRQIVFLPDSSKVILAANSTIKFPREFINDERLIKLKGKAYFEVTHDILHPFIINTAHNKIKVLGTRFLVDASHKNQELVAVDRGKVAFQNRSKSSSAVLVAQEIGTWNSNNDQIQKSNNPNLNKNSYLSGRFCFENEPIYKLVEILNSFYSPHKIKLDGVDSELTLSGNFDNLQLDEIIKIIKSALDLKVEKEKDQYLLKP